MRRFRRVAVLLATIVATVALAGCGAPPDKAVTGFLDDFKALNVTEAQKHLVSPGPFADPEPAEQAVMQAIMGKVSYKVTGSTISGSEAKVSVAITSPDMVEIVGAALEEILPTAMDAADKGGTEADVLAIMEQAIVQGTGAANAPLTTSQVTVTMQKLKGEWKLAPTDDEVTALFNALTGNVVQAYDVSTDEGTE